MPRPPLPLQKRPSPPSPQQKVLHPQHRNLQPLRASRPPLRLASRARHTSPNPTRRSQSVLPSRLQRPQPPKPRQKSATPANPNGAPDQESHDLEAIVQDRQRGILSGSHRPVRAGRQGSVQARRRQGECQGVEDEEVQRGGIRGSFVRLLTFEASHDL